MENYKPGQVSALLFSSKSSAKRKKSSDDILTSLFTPNKREKPTTHDDSAKPGSPNIKTQTPSKKSKLPKETTKEKVKKQKMKLKEEKKSKDNLSTKKENPGQKETTTEMPYLHETLVKSNSLKAPKTSPKKLQKAGVKRKLEEEDKEDEERDEKRQRRNRKRDKRADKRTVFVGNCPLSADKKTLKSLFKDYGCIESIRIRCAPAADPNLPKRATVITKNFHDQCNNCVAYIVFNDEEAAKKSLVRNGHFLDGLHLRVDIAANSRKHDKKRSIFVGNLPFTITEETIRSHFKDCGTITNVRIVRDRTTSLGKGICYVQFESKDSVSLALRLNSWEIQGRKARVMACTSKAKQEEAKTKENKRPKKSGDNKPRAKKVMFGPSNATSSTFTKKLQAKKEKRMKKKKLKNKAKKGDGLSAIFGDAPAIIPSTKQKNQKAVKKGSTLGDGSKRARKGQGEGKRRTKQGVRKGSNFRKNFKRRQ